MKISNARWRRRAPRLAGRLAGVVMIGTAVAAASSGHSMTLAIAPANASTGPTLTVTPSTGLGNESVSVHWTNFANPTQFGADYVAIYQCKANPQSLHDCFAANAFPSSENGNRILTAITGIDLTGTANFEVRDSSSLPELGCDDVTSCSIVAFDANVAIPDTTLPAGAVVAPITFARNANKCPIPEAFDAVIGGEASAAQQLYRWAAQLCTANQPITIDFSETSSTDARETALLKQADVAITSLPASSEELAAGVDTASLAYAPVSLNASVFAFNVNDARTGQPITDMTLTPRLIARLITDSQLLGFFQDPEFLALNPGHNWPAGGASQPALRSERNADTHIATDWMYHDTNAKLLIAGTDIHRVRVMSDFRDKNYPVENFETALSDNTGFVPHNGEQDASTRLFYQARPDGQHFANQGYIGLISRSNALRFGLSMAKLVTGPTRDCTGQPSLCVGVAPDAAGLAAGLKTMKLVDGILVPDAASTDTRAYPLTKIDYAMLRTVATNKDAAGHSVPDPAKAASLKALLSYAIAEGQHNLANGYLPLPVEQIAVTQAVIDRITSPTPQTTTTTAPSSTTTSSTATTIVDQTTPTTQFNDSGNGNGGHGSGSCCASNDSTPPIDATTVPETTVTTNTSASPTTAAHQLRYALTAPNWVPISNIGPIPANIALPLLMVLGAVCLLFSTAIPAVQRFVAWRLQLTQGKVAT